MRQVAILGSTGSIGENALDVIRRLNKRKKRAEYGVWALSAGSNVERLKKQILEFKPKAAAVSESAAAASLRAWAASRRLDLRVWEGASGLERISTRREVDLLLSSVVGAVGLAPLAAAVKAGKKVALANKEALIVAGELIARQAKKSGSEIIPVDSEHSAIFQCLGASRGQEVRRLILTASGGAFYRREGPLSSVTPREALRHPTWKMGRKITIDCATLMNKGLEAIEAHHLFGVPLEKIEILIHPQSIVHSIVEFSDGAQLAQLSAPDMRLPIQYALTHPGRLPTPIKTLELERVHKLEFYKPDFSRFPCLGLALQAGRRGGTWPAVLNGANEAAVRAFLDGDIPFTGIPRLIRRVMGLHKPRMHPDLKGIEAASQWAQGQARLLISKGKI